MILFQRSLCVDQIYEKPKCHRLYHWAQDSSVPQHLPSSSFSTAMLWQPDSLQTKPQHTQALREFIPMQKASAKSGVAKACQDSTSLLYFLKNYDLKKQEKTLAKQPLSFFVPSNSKKNGILLTFVKRQLQFLVKPYFSKKIMIKKSFNLPLWTPRNNLW